MQQLTRRRPTSSILTLRLLSLLSLLLIGPCHPQPISCNNETESLFQLWFDNFSSYSSSSLSSGINTDGKESVLFPSSGSIVWKLQQRNNRHVAAGTLRYHSYESWEELPEEEILCIPKNECYLLEVEDLTLDQFRVELDGIPITPGPAYPIHHGAAIESTTEIGHACKPTCNPINETLLDVTVFMGESNQVDWKIIDDSHHGTVMSSCRQHENTNYCGWDAWETYHVHECLLTASVANPANSFSCYRFLWRDASENLNPPGHRTYPHITLTADFISVPVVPSTTTNSTDKKNMTISSTNATTPTNTLEMDAMAPFESVWLGGSSHNHCHPSCQNVNQSQLELFVSRDETSSSSSLSTTQPQKQVDWSLVDLVREEVAYKDSILWEDGSSGDNAAAAAGDTWHYVQHCVPRDACLEFFLSMSQREPTEETTIVATTTAQTESSTTTTTTTQTTKTTSSGQYMLLLDNIMYADNNNYQFSIGGEDPKQKDRVVTNGIIIGNDCPSTICKSNSFSYEASGSLMALELVAMTASSSSAAKEAAADQNNTVTNTTTTTSTATTSTINTGSYYHLEWSLSGVTQYSDKSTTTMKGYFGYNRSGYRRYDCIPQHCFHLDVSVDDAKTQAIDSYSVTVDGRLYEDAKLNRFGQDDGPGWYQLSFLDCKDEEEDFITSAGISGGALAAAIVCSILGACLCVYIANRVLNLSKEYDRRMNNRNNITDDDEKTTASEDRHDDEPIGRIVHIPGASEEDP